MKGPRSIAESVNSAQYGRPSASASAGVLSLSSQNYPRLEAGHPSGGETCTNDGVVHRSAARAVVEKYERLCTPPPRKNSSKRAGNRQDHDSWNIPVAIGKGDGQDVGSKKSKRSPLRQSIRSLLSALRKGATKSGEAVASTRRSSKSNIISVDKIGPPLAPENTFGDKPNEIPLQPATVSGTTYAVGKDQDKVARSGPLWRLASTQLLGDPQPLVAWVLCTGVVKSRKLILTWPADPTAHPNVHELDLSTCVDVRPLANGELYKEEHTTLSMLDSTRQLRVFEIVLHGRESEKFAVRSLGERAVWISTLWDSILPTERSTAGTSNSQHEPMQWVNSNRTSEVVNLAARTEEPVPPSGVEKDVFWSTERKDRSLPPLPPKNHKSLPPLTIPTNSLISKVDIMPRIDSAGTPSPSIYSPISSSSTGRTGGPPLSPSIANLGRQSMVKTRLAEIQREQGQGTPTSLNTQIDRMLLPASPASTARTGRSGFLSTLKSEDSDKDIGVVRTPFGHLRESNFFGDLQVTEATSESREQTTDVRPPLESSDSTCSELPYVNDEVESPARKDGERLESRLEEIAKPPSVDENTINNILGGESGRPLFHQMLERIDGRTRSTKRTVEELVQKFESLCSSSREHRRGSEDDKKLHLAYEQTRETLETTRSELSGKMDTLMGQLTKMNNAVSAIPRPSQPPASIQAEISATDMNALRKHMDDALSTQLMPLRERIAISGSSSHPLVLEELSRIAALVENDDKHRASLVQQHADSVRYLNELNSWLENFVRHGTSQIKGMATNIEHLCRNLGPNHEGVLHDIYTMLSELRNRGDMSTFQDSLEKIAEAINQNPQNQMNVQALASFMERQRQDQESFLRAFTAQVSGEIKGERLRFVEAMKEATTINVQAQVAQLKKELAREVTTVAQELSRLESDKRAVETKIANLHAFHMNQKQTIGAHAPLTVTAARQTYRSLSQQGQFQAHGGYHRRPLPYPH